MKSFKKGILALGLTLGIIASLGGAAFAGSTSHGIVNGFLVTAKSNINYYEGSAYTQYEIAGGAEVYSYYYYVNPTTGYAGRMVKQNGGIKYARVEFAAPKNCRSLQINSSHKLSAYGEKWSANTTATYDS